MSNNASILVSPVQAASAIEQVAHSATDTTATELLNALELLLVGGGSGNAIFG
jgi:hypothetical protein